MTLALLASVCLAPLQLPVTPVLAAKLTPGPNAVVGGEFGARVALDDGRAAIAAIGEQFDTGAVYVHDRLNGVWSLTQRIAPSDAPGGSFGLALALSGDRLVVGLPSASLPAYATGAVRTYTFDGASWTLEAHLQPTDAAGSDFFGQCVALSGDTLAVGCPFDDTSVVESGSAYVYRRIGGAWTLEQKIVAPDAAPADRFGVALDLDGDTLVVGAHQEDNVQPNSGQVYVFTRSGAVWSEQARLKASDPNAGQWFGEDVALEGSRLIVGAPGDNATSFNGGAAYVFENDGVSWTQRAKLTAVVPSQTERFGSAVALSGNFAAAGAWQNAEGGGNSGAAYLFESSAGAWFQAAKLKPTDSAAGDRFGNDVALDGGDWINGAMLSDGPVQDAGSAYIYRILKQPIVYCTAKVNSLGCLPQMASQGESSLSSATPFDVYATSIVSGRLGVLLYGLSGRSQVPFAGGLLCVRGPVRRSPAQSSGGAPSGLDCTGEYHFDFNALAQSGSDPHLVVGQVVDAQYWYRDPPSSGAIGLSDALEFELTPR
jgi:hypothetical protein